MTLRNIFKMFFRMQHARAPQTGFSFPLPDLDDEVEPVNDDCWVNNLVLPVCRSSDSCVHMISPETLCNVLEGRYNESFDNLFILDSRFGYEYEGGHIRGAQNVTAADLQSMFFNRVIDRAVVIIHCEFSKNRGPELASIFRKIDREMNISNYPNVFYPDVYVLKGGYQAFYAKYPQFCDGGYVKMRDKNHRDNGDLLNETKRFRELSKLTKSVPLFESCNTLRIREKLPFDMNYEKSNSFSLFQEQSTNYCYCSIFN